MYFQPRVQEHYKAVTEKFGEDNVIATMVYGSQNYNMATETSDVDTKSLLVPTVKSIILGEKQISTDLVLPDSSLAGVKDYRGVFDLWLKGNVRFLEILYTDYFVLNPAYGNFFFGLRRNRELIANSLPRKLMHSAAGMAKQKFEALKHPYPSKVEILERWGYDPKQLHHLVRLYHFMDKFMETLSFAESLRPSEPLRHELMNIKTQPMPLAKAEHVAAMYLDRINTLLDQCDNGMIPEEMAYKEAVDYLNQLTLNIFKYRYDLMEEE